MKLLFYPDYSDKVEGSSFGKFFKKDLATHPLRWQVSFFIDELATMNNFDEHIKRGYIKPLQNKLYEMRIPPVRKGGVVRVYFCFAIDDPQTLIILDAELKHDKDAQKIDRALARCVSYTKGAQTK